MVLAAIFKFIDYFFHLNKLFRAFYLNNLFLNLEIYEILV